MTCPRDKTPSDDENNAPDSPSQPPQKQDFDENLMNVFLNIQNQCQLPTPRFVGLSDAPEVVNEFIKYVKNSLLTLGISIFEQLGRCDPNATREQHKKLQTLLQGIMGTVASERTSLKRAAENSENAIPTKKYSQKETVDKITQRLSRATRKSKMIRKEVDRRMNCDDTNRPSTSGIPPIRTVENSVSNELPGPIRRRIQLQTGLFKTDDCLTVEKFDGKDVAQSSRLPVVENSSPRVVSSDSAPSFKNYGYCGLKCVRSSVKSPNQPSSSEIPPTKPAMNPFKTESPGNHTSGKKGESTSSDARSSNRSPNIKATDSPQRSSKKSPFVSSRRGDDESESEERVDEILLKYVACEALEILKSSGNSLKDPNQPSTSGIPQNKPIGNSVINNSLISSNLKKDLNSTETGRIESENIPRQGNKQNRNSKTPDDVKSSKNNRQDTTESSTSKGSHVDPYSPYPHLDYIHRLTSSDSGLLEQTSSEKTENPGNFSIGNERESTSSDDRVFKKNSKIKAIGSEQYLKVNLESMSSMFDSPQRSSKKSPLVRSRQSHDKSGYEERVEEILSKYEAWEALEILKSSGNSLKDPNQPSTSEVPQVGLVGNSVVRNFLIPSSLTEDSNLTETVQIESENIPKRGNKRNRYSKTPDDVKSSKNILKDSN